MLWFFDIWNPYLYLKSFVLDSFFFKPKFSVNHFLCIWLDLLSTVLLNPSRKEGMDCYELQYWIWIRIQQWKFDYLMCKETTLIFQWQDAENKDRTFQASKFMDHWLRTPSPPTLLMARKYRRRSSATAVTVEASYCERRVSLSTFLPLLLIRKCNANEYVRAIRVQRVNTFCASHRYLYRFQST